MYVSAHKVYTNSLSHLNKRNISKFSSMRQCLVQLSVAMPLVRVEFGVRVLLLSIDPNPNSNPNPNPIMDNNGKG